MSIGTCTDTLQLTSTSTGTVPLTYSWTNGAHLDNPSIESPTITNNPGAGTYEYIVTVTDVYGCIDRDTVEVVIDPSPTITTIDAVSIGECTDTLQLTSTSTGTVPLTYSWTRAADLDNASIESPTITNNPGAGTYRYVVTITDVYGCTSKDSVDVTVDPSPTIATIADVSIGTCTDTLQVTCTSTGTVPLTYSWTNGAHLDNASIESPTITKNPGSGT